MEGAEFVVGWLMGLPAGLGVLAWMRIGIGWNLMRLVGWEESGLVIWKI